MGTQYHLTRYAFLYETTTAADGELLSPSDSPGGEQPALAAKTQGRLMMHHSYLGLKAIFESIDNRNDFKKYMQNFAVARGSMRTIRRDGPQDDGFVSANQLESKVSELTGCSARPRHSHRTSKPPKLLFRARRHLLQKRRSFRTAILAAWLPIKSLPSHSLLHPTTLYPAPPIHRARLRHTASSLVNRWFATAQKCPRSSKSVLRQ